MNSTLVIGMGEIGKPLADILSISYSVQRRDAVDTVIEGNIDWMHICFPYSETFVSDTLAYIELYCPGHCIIHSTVVPGTSRKIQDATSCCVAYSPVRGRHEYMHRDMIRYSKFVTGDSPADAVAYLRSAGFDVHSPDAASMSALELAKIVETSYSALLIAWAQELERVCVTTDVDRETVLSFTEEVEYLPGHIFYPGMMGGHCLMQNLDLLQAVFPPSLFVPVIRASNRLRERGARQQSYPLHSAAYRENQMKLSLILMVWNTSHLMARTLYTLKKQTMDDWELIVVDDNSEDDVPGCLCKHGEGLPIHYHRLEHDFGMRGNTFSINYGVEQAQGHVVMWSTPEVMLPPGTLEAIYDTHIAQHNKLLWVTVPSHGLTTELQLRMDETDWQFDIHNIKHLIDGTEPDNWNSVWFHLNFHKDGRRNKQSRQEAGIAFGNNQTVAVVRQRWLDTVGSFPLFMDYGTDDPWISDERKKHGYEDLTLWDQEAYHQWHPRSQYWMAQGKAPNWNKYGHTTSNLLGDPRVPDSGTCEIWDKGDKSPLDETEIRNALTEHGNVVATGFRECTR